LEKNKVVAEMGNLENKENIEKKIVENTPCENVNEHNQQASCDSESMPSENRQDNENTKENIESCKISQDSDKESCKKSEQNGDKESFGKTMQESQLENSESAKQEKDIESSENSMQNVEENDGGQKVENSQKLDTYQQNVNGDSPEYNKDEWQDKTRRFLEDYPLGRSFVEQIGEEIVHDETLSHNPNCLEIALARVLSKAYMSPKDIINNQEFREKYVYDNVEIKSVIVDKYLRSLDEQKPPATMERGGQILFVPPDKPKSIDEAGELVRKMLKNRRN